MFSLHLGIQRQKRHWEIFCHSMLNDKQKKKCHFCFVSSFPFSFAVKPRCLPGINFVRLLGDDDEAFHVLYCTAFAMMDAQWLAMRDSCMEFNMESILRRERRVEMCIESEPITRST